MLKNFSKLLKSSAFHRVLWTALALTLGIGICQFKVDYIESLTYDGRVRALPNPPTTDLLQIVEITEKSKQSLGQMPNARDHIQFLQRISKAQPKAILYAVDLGTITGDYVDLEEFTKTANKSNVMVAGNTLSNTGGDGEILPPLNQLSIHPGFKSTDTISFGKDGVTRRWIHQFQGTDLLFSQILKTYAPEKLPEEIRGLFEYKRTVQGRIEFRRSGFYPQTEFTKVLKGEADLSQFKDKIVIVGVNAQASIANYLKTPFSRDITAMSLPEMHANILDTIMLNRAPVIPPKWINLILTTLISLLTVFVVLSLRPTNGMAILLATLGGFTLFSLAMLYFFQVSVVMAHPLLAIFVCYYFLIPYRLIQENRKSWEYYQKNNLLMKVEELKTNFLKMMSHDLKTPLARIQGMTDIVLKDHDKLSTQQKEAVETIGQSSVELSEFIGSILSYGRIESKEIKLMLQSRDVNQLIEEVVKKSGFLASGKNIQLITELEPMFSANFDPDLIKQVITNLVENAIKYSPKNSKVLISSEEVDGKIFIQVADQGYGIPEDEIESVFTKFYRSKSVTGGSIKGSGLGLYLSNYFVNLHRGTISVESVYGQGSTFTVELPTDLGKKQPGKEKRRKKPIEGRSHP